MANEERIVTVGQAARYFDKTIDESSKSKALTVKLLKKLYDNFVNPDVPSEYTKLEYIYFDGNQLIDTEFNPNQNTRVICKINFTVLDNDIRCIFGARNSSSKESFTLWKFSDTVIRYDYGDVQNPMSFSPHGIFLIDANKNSITINSETNTFSPKQFTSPYSMKIGSTYSNSPANSDQNHNDTRRFKGNLYYFRIYNNEILVRDFVPVERNDGVLGLYDIINKKFYTNFGTGNFSKGPEVKTVESSQFDNRVVKAYQFKKAVYPYYELEYIESTGSQYINTNYIPKTNTRMVFDVQATDLNGEWLTFYGCRSGSLDQQFALYSNNKTRYRSNFGPDAGIYGGTPTTERILIDQTGPQLKINNTVIITHPSIELNSQDALFLLAVNTHGRIELPIKARIYSCKIYTGTNLSLDLIPVRKKENGEIGLLDKVNNVFYKNYTTGSFIGGPEI